MTRLILSMFVCFALGFGVTVALAEPSSTPTSTAAPPKVDAVSGGHVANAASVAAASLDAPADPLASPAAALDELRAAKRLGWAAALFYIAWQLSLLVGKLGGAVPWLAKLKHGRYAVVVGAVAALSAAGFNAIALGGTLIAAVVAAAVAALTFVNSNQDTKPQAVPF